MFKRTQINLQKSHLWDIIWELSSNLDEIQEEVTESSNFKQPKLNIKQQLEQVRLQKKLEYNNYQSQQWDKISNDQDIYPPETCVVIGDLILNGIIEENLSKQHSGRIRKFPGATVDDLNYHLHPILHKIWNTSLSTKKQIMLPIQHLGTF